MAKTTKEKDLAGRRDFLKLAGLGTVMSGAALVAGNAEAATAADENGKGYRETEHVITFYDLARF